MNKPSFKELIEKLLIRKNIQPTEQNIAITCNSLIALLLMLTLAPVSLVLMFFYPYLGGVIILLLITNLIEAVYKFNKLLNNDRINNLN